MQIISRSHPVVHGTVRTMLDRVERTLASPMFIIAKARSSRVAASEGGRLLMCSPASNREFEYVSIRHLKRVILQPKSRIVEAGESRDICFAEDKRRSTLQ